MEFGEFGFFSHHEINMTFYLLLSRVSELLLLIMLSLKLNILDVFLNYEIIVGGKKEEFALSYAVYSVSLLQVLKVFLFVKGIKLYSYRFVMLILPFLHHNVDITQLIHYVTI